MNKQTPKFIINTNYNNKLTVEQANKYLDYFKNIKYSDDYKKYSKKLLEILFEIHRDENGAANGFFYNVSRVTFSPGTLFYRARPIKQEYIPTLKNDVSQFWAPNHKIAKLNRLNLEGNPMLYACHKNKKLPIIETNIEINNHFILIEYKNIKDIKLRHIGQFYTPSNSNVIYSSHIKELFDAMNNFVIDLFTYKYPQNDYYYFTNGIKEELFPLENCRGYYYPSAYNKNEYNVCFKPNVENDELHLKSVYHCILKGYDEKGIPDYIIESQIL